MGNQNTRTTLQINEIFKNILKQRENHNFYNKTLCAVLAHNTRCNLLVYVVTSFHKSCMLEVYGHIRTTKRNEKTANMIS